LKQSRRQEIIETYNLPDVESDSLWYQPETYFLIAALIFLYLGWLRFNEWRAARDYTPPPEPSRLKKLKRNISSKPPETHKGTDISSAPTEGHAEGKEKDAAP